MISLLLFSRRGSTITNPQVWAEDGVRYLPDFIEYGIGSLIIPISGYLVVIPRIIAGLSLSLPYEYPFISTLLAWLFIIFVITIICYGPLLLKYRSACAIGCLLIPCDPEVFGVPLYSIWWAGLLIIVISIWKNNVKWEKLRVLMLSIAALSSPIIIISTPIFLLRCLYFKKKIDKILFTISAFCTTLQLYFVLNNNLSSGYIDYNEKRITWIFKKFFGYFIFNENSLFNPYLWVLSYMLLAYLFVVLYISKYKFSCFVLFYFMLINIIVSVYRVDISLLNPISGGPRYFFLPFIMIFWILVQGIASSEKFFLKCFTLSLILMMVFNSITTSWSREHDDLEWAKNTESAKYFLDGFHMPIQYDGYESNAYKIFYNTYLFSKIYCNKFNFNNQEIFLYDTYNFDVRNTLNFESFLNIESITNIEIQDFPRKMLNERGMFRVRFKNSKVTNRLCSFSCLKNQKMIFSTSSSINDIQVVINCESWVNQTRLKASQQMAVLDFRSMKLPNEFTVELIGAKSLKSGEWLDIYFIE